MLKIFFNVWDEQVDLICDVHNLYSPILLLILQSLNKTIFSILWNTRYYSRLWALRSEKNKKILKKRSEKEKELVPSRDNSIAADL